jgi:hypothetical protein
MNRQRLSILAALAFLAAVLAGCALDTPQARLATAERSYQAAADSTRLLVASHALDGKPDVLRAIRLANDEAYNALVKARTYTAAGQKIDAGFWLDRVLAFVAESEARRAAEKEPK